MPFGAEALEAPESFLRHLRHDPSISRMMPRTARCALRSSTGPSARIAARAASAVRRFPVAIKQPGCVNQATGEDRRQDIYGGCADHRGYNARNQPRLALPVSGAR